VCNFNTFSPKANPDRIKTVIRVEGIDKSTTDTISTFNGNDDRVTSSGSEACEKTWSRNNFLTCMLCRMPFDCELKLQKHGVAHGVPPNLKCLSCPMDFVNYDSLKTHSLSHKHYKCNQCPFAAKHYCVLQIHIEQKHSAKQMVDEKSHMCTVCGRYFTMIGTLNDHMMTHTGERKYRCKICDKAFIQHSTMTTHMYSHGLPKPHICTVCGMGFIRPSNLQDHMTIHTGEGTYPCTKCGETFSQMQNLCKHEAKHGADKDLECVVCNAKFKTNAKRKVHMLIHAGEPCEVCPVCNERFHRKGSLKVHLRTHT